MRILRFQPGPKTGDWIIHCHWPTRLMQVSEVSTYIWARYHDRGAVLERIVERQCIFTVEPSAEEIAEWEGFRGPTPPPVREHKGLPGKRGWGVRRG